MTPEQILAMARNSGPKELREQLMKQLSPEQGRQLKQILNDKAALDRLMASEQAQQLMKHYHGSNQ